MANNDEPNELTGAAAIEYPANRVWSFIVRPRPDVAERGSADSDCDIELAQKKLVVGAVRGEGLIQFMR